MVVFTDGAGEVCKLVVVEMPDTFSGLAAAGTVWGVVSVGAGAGVFNARSLLAAATVGVEGAATALAVTAD